MGVVGVGEGGAAVGVGFGLEVEELGVEVGLEEEAGVGFEGEVVEGGGEGVDEVGFGDLVGAVEGVGVESGGDLDGEEG